MLSRGQDQFLDLRRERNQMRPRGLAAGITSLHPALRDRPGAGIEIKFAMHGARDFAPAQGGQDQHAVNLSEWSMQLLRRAPNGRQLVIRQCAVPWRGRLSEQEGLLNRGAWRQLQSDLAIFRMSNRPV